MFFLSEFFLPDLVLVGHDNFVGFFSDYYFFHFFTFFILIIYLFIYFFIFFWLGLTIATILQVFELYLSKCLSLEYAWYKSPPKKCCQSIDKAINQIIICCTYWLAINTCLRSVIGQNIWKIFLSTIIKVTARAR